MEEQNISIVLTVDQANIVLTALSKLPFETVADLIVLIRHQAQEQLQSPPTSPPVSEVEID